jgi:hypothetical protein
LKEKKESEPGHPEPHTGHLSIRSVLRKTGSLRLARQRFASASGFFNYYFFLF